jgi:molecular chaperone DnaK
MGIIIGIDLGTSYSAAAVRNNAKSILIPDHSGHAFIPSVVAVNERHEVLVGMKAKDQAILNPKNSVTSIKRFLGRKFNDPDVQKAIHYLPFELSACDNGDLQVLMDENSYSPQEITAIILAKLRKNAEVYLNDKVTQAVIAVPAVFNSIQRKAIIDSGKIAGLEVLRVISESTAFSLAHHFGQKKNETIMIVNMGSGFISTSIIDIGAGVWEVKSMSGDNIPGGDEFDQRILSHLIEEFKKNEGIDLQADRLALGRLKEAAEKARVELSSMMEAEINLPCISVNESGLKNLQIKMTRTDLEQLTDDLVKRALKSVEQELKDANMGLTNIDKVIFAGGLMHMPRIQEMFKKMFRPEPHQDVNPKERVACGAAIHAGVLGGIVKDVLLLDVASQTLSMETSGGVATRFIERNTTIPTLKTKVFSTVTDKQTLVDIHIVEGEQPMAAENKSLGLFTLDGIPSAPKGIPQIEVRFEIDANGILNVAAQDKATGRRQNVTINSSYGLSAKEIEQAKCRLEENMNLF